MKSHTARRVDNDSARRLVPIRSRLAHDAPCAVRGVLSQFGRSPRRQASGAHQLRSLGTIDDTFPGCSSEVDDGLASSTEISHGTGEDERKTPGERGGGALDIDWGGLEVVDELARTQADEVRRPGAARTVDIIVESRPAEVVAPPIFPAD